MAINLNNSKRQKPLLTILISTLFVISVLSVGSIGRAQALPDIFGGACQTVTNLGGDNFEWLCTAGQLVGKVESLVKSLHTDMASFAQDLFDTWFSDALRTLGTNLPGTAIDGALQELQNAITEGPAVFRAKVREVMDGLRLSNRSAPRAPEDTPDWWLEQATRANPNLAVGEARNEQRVAELTTMNAEAHAAHAMNEALAKEVSESTASRDAMTAVLGLPTVPGVPNSNQGTAHKLSNSKFKNSAWFNESSNLLEWKGH